MSKINGVDTDIWIAENCPENGLFRAYWTEDGVGVSLEDTGFGLRYEWYYKDGIKDGISKGWWPNSQLKDICTWKSGKRDGLWIEWYDDGQKSSEFTLKNGKFDGLWTRWYKNGQKKIVGPFKDRGKDGIWSYWDKNGQKTDQL
jgi:antitoxin component YwqK of YwqJK toxin-antitoxin module